ncbi:MAG TPA: hypothetical protein VKN14_10170 [Flavobacteriaceae bacterium]|nr:hypothetical protein [Flavobacteriaceae bacterium]
MSDILERQLFDMNCNNCIHMTRSFVERQKHEDFHYEMQKKVFNAGRLKLLTKAEQHLKKGKKDKAKALFKEVKSMKFVYDGGSTSLSFGICNIKDKKKVFSFIPDILMEENYHCFEHRKTK